MILLDKGLYRSALKQFEQSVIYANTPNSEASCYNNMGVCLSRLKLHKEAVEAYDKAVQVSPFDSKNRGLYFYNRAISHQHNSNFQLAIQDYSRSIQFEEQDHTTLAKKLKQRGTCFSMTQQFQKAVEDFSQCIQHEEQDKSINQNIRAEAFYLRANDYRKLKNYTSALSDLDRAIELRKIPDASLFQAKAVTFRKIGEYEKAKENHNLAIQLKPNVSKYKESLNKTLQLSQQKPSLESSTNTISTPNTSPLVENSTINQNVKSTEEIPNANK